MAIPILSPGNYLKTTQDNLKLAVAAILAATFALSLGDALIKRESVSFVLWQIFVMRSLIVMPFLIYFVRIHSCDTSLMPVRPGWTLLRSLLLVTMWVFYFTALPRVELAIAAAAYYTLPLFITLFAAWFLGDRITPRAWLAVLTGFAGTLLILQPQADDFNAYTLLPIVSAICYAGAMILTRSKCQGEKPAILSLWLNIGFVAAGALALLLLQLWQPRPDLIARNAFLLGEWTPMRLDEWRVMGILAVMILIGSIGAAIAYQKGPSAIIATFDFAYVGLAAVWGFVFFSEIPGPLVLLGIAMIVGAGIVAVRQTS